MAVCSEIHTKHTNTVCGQNVELLNVKLVVHIVTTGLYKGLIKTIIRTTNAISVHSVYIPGNTHYAISTQGSAQFLSKQAPSLLYSAHTDS